MANYTHNQPTVTAHRNVFVVDGDDDGGRRRHPKAQEYATNMLIPYAKGRIVKVRGERLRIIDDGETDLGSNDVTPTTTWKCERL